MIEREKAAQRDGVDVLLFAQPWALPGALPPTARARALLGATCRLGAHVRAPRQASRASASELSARGVTTRAAFAAAVALSAARASHARLEASRSCAAAVLQRAARCRAARSLAGSLRARRAVQQADDWRQYSARRKDAAARRPSERGRRARRRGELAAIVAGLSRAREEADAEGGAYDSDDSLSSAAGEFAEPAGAGGATDIKWRGLEERSSIDGALPPPLLSPSSGPVQVFSSVSGSPITSSDDDAEHDRLPHTLPALPPSLPVSPAHASHSEARGFDVVYDGRAGEISLEGADAGESD